MAKTLEQYTAEATQAYLPSQQAIQKQLGSLDSQYATGEQKINRQYAQQQSQLENQRNQAAESASLQAAGSGGSFGGSANIANRKYYEQSFVPAQTQLQTNQANDLDALRQNIENQRTNLNSQLANLQAQANQEALRQYWAEIEAEKNRAAQRAAANASNAYYQDLMNAMKNGANGQSGNGRSGVDFITWVSNYSGYDNKTKNALLNGLNNTAKFKNASVNIPFLSSGAQSALNNKINNSKNSNQIVQDATANALQNSVYYKQYQNWLNGR